MCLDFPSDLYAPHREQREHIPDNPSQPCCQFSSVLPAATPRLQYYPYTYLVRVCRCAHSSMSKANEPVLSSNEQELAQLRADIGQAERESRPALARTLPISTPTSLPSRSWPRRSASTRAQRPSPRTRHRTLDYPVSFALHCSHKAPRPPLSLDRRVRAFFLLAAQSTSTMQHTAPRFLTTDQLPSTRLARTHPVR